MDDASDPDRTRRIPVTVVIPAYERAQLVGRAVRSVHAQRPTPPAEIIVVDDGSTDGTAEAARQAGATVLSLPENLGQGAARNAGIHAATCSWVALLDSDDEWLPDHLARLWEAREGFVLVGDSCVTDITRRYSGNPRRRPRVLRTPADVLWPSNAVPANCAMFRRDDALAVGGFGTRMLAEDLEFWVRLLERGPGLSLPSLGAHYHEHPGQISRHTRVAMDEALEEVLAQMQSRPWNAPRLRRQLAAVAAWDRARDLAQTGRRGAALRIVVGLSRPADAAAVATRVCWRLRMRVRGRQVTRGLARG